MCEPPSRLVLFFDFITASMSSFEIASVLGTGNIVLNVVSFANLCGVSGHGGAELFSQ